MQLICAFVFAYAKSMFSYSVSRPLNCYEAETKLGQIALKMSATASINGHNLRQVFVCFVLIVV